MPFTERLAIVAVVALGFAVGSSPLLAQKAAPASNPPYLNPSLPDQRLNPSLPDQRVNDLISRMTLEEKASQLVNQARFLGCRCPRTTGGASRCTAWR
jgi:hypothetical protein